MIAPWRVRLLGEFSLERGEEKQTRFRSQKTAALLAYLCLNARRDHGREELIALFWPEEELDAGRNNLRVTLSSLRKILEPPPTPTGSVLIATRTHVRIRPETIQTDVAAFEEALKKGDQRTALTLYEAGSFLPGIYEEWALLERERLEARADEAREAVAQEPASPTPSASGKNAPVQLANNLPLTLTRFFGREEELSRLEMLLRNPSQRVITLAGQGGVGKTRLMVESARRLLQGKANGGAITSLLPGGIWFVPLAEVFDPGYLSTALPALLRDALRLPPSPAQEPLEQIREALAGGGTLFLLDNLEQVADGVLAALLPILEELPSARFVATSRVRLGIPGERIVTIGPLPLPAEEETQADQLATNAAVALFVDRARAVEVEFGLTERGASDVAHLVSLLEGVPLAIELAAAWANVLSPRQMGEQLQRSEHASLDAFPVRRSGEREERHSSLRAVIRWSYDLLPPDLRQLFTRLSVFRGGFTTEAATAVCEEPHIHAALSRLHQYSLLTTRPVAEGVLRFGLLETLREFAMEQLSGEEADRLAARHAEYYATLADLPGGPAAFVSDADNVRVALTFYESQPTGTGLSDAFRLATAFSEYWWTQGRWEEGAETLGRLAALAESQPEAVSTEVIGRALRDAGGLAFYRGDLGAAADFACRQEVVAVAHGEPKDIAAARHSRGAIAAAQGNWEDARRLLTEALRYYQAREDGVTNTAGILVSLAWVCRAEGALEESDALIEEALPLYRDILSSGGGVALCRSGQGESARLRGDLEQARLLYQEALALFRSTNEVLRIGQTLVVLAELYLAGNNDSAASLCLNEALEILRTQPNRPAQASALESVARMAAHRGLWQESARFLGAADQVRGSEAARFALYATLRSSLYREVEAHMSASVFTEALAQGKNWSSESAFAAAEALAKS